MQEGYVLPFSECERVGVGETKGQDKQCYSDRLIFWTNLGPEPTPGALADAGEGS